MSSEEKRAQQRARYRRTSAERRADPAAHEAFKRRKRELVRRQSRDPEYVRRRRERSRAWYQEAKKTPAGWARHRTKGKNCVLATVDELVALIERQGGRCAVTGRVLQFGLGNKHPLQPTIDHVIPRAEGGSSTIENLRVVIWAVNAARGPSSQHDGIIADLFGGASP